MENYEKKLKLNKQLFDYKYISTLKSTANREYT